MPNDESPPWHDKPELKAWDEELTAKFQLQKQSKQSKSSGKRGDNSARKEIDGRPAQYSDDALALRFSAMHADKARYLAARNKWLFWTGTYWRTDETLQVFDMSRSICRAAAAELTDARGAKIAAAVTSAKTVAAVVSLARSDRRHASTSDDWDSDLMLFLTPED